MSSSGNREEEAEFGLQRAETGDRRLSQNSPSGPASDLRAAHSSDFFSGQRDRGRDDSPAPQPPSPSRPPQASRQSFRRVTTPRPTSPTTQYTTPPPPPPQPSNPPQYEGGSKRKLVRKRPIYVSTKTPTLAPSTSQPTFPPQPQLPQEQQLNKFFIARNPSQNRQTTAPPANVPPQYKDEYVEVSRVTPKPNRYYPNNPTPLPFSPSTSAPNFNKKESLIEVYKYEAQSTPGINLQKDNGPFKVKNSFSVSDAPREDFVRTNININPNGGRLPTTTVDYNNVSSRGFGTSTPAYKNFNSVSYEPEKNNFVSFSGAKQNYFNSPSTSPPTTTTYTTQRSNPPPNLNTVAYNTNIAFNTIQSANYEDGNDGEDDGQYRPPQGEDDGQYRPELYEREQVNERRRVNERERVNERGGVNERERSNERQRANERERVNERDQANDRELLSGAHSLNIAASGNRLPEDQKSRGKQHTYKIVAQTSAPRPFRPAPPPTSVAPPQTTYAPEPTYTTTYRAPTYNTQRTFDYFQTYTTTSRPKEAPVPQQPSVNLVTVSNGGPTTTFAPRTPESRPQTRAPAPPPTFPPARPTTRAPQFANPPNKQEDASYDYAYYDSDSGFSEYDHIEEFGRTKTRA